jgi:hypothetical protein
LQPDQIVKQVRGELGLLNVLEVVLGIVLGIALEVVKVGDR